MKILVIEDESKIANNLKQGLTENGFDTDVAFDGAMGLKCYYQTKYDLLIVDAILPGKNGFEICREVRSGNQNISILMLTALGTTNDKVEGLDAGADDYLVKPFDFRELLARIRALAKRSAIIPYASEYLKIHDLELDLTRKTAKRGDLNIELTAKEFGLLEYMMKNKGRVLSRQQITEKVWDLDFDTGTNVVDVYVNLLRKKIDAQFEVKLIKTRIGMGYMIDNI